MTMGIKNCYPVNYTLHLLQKVYFCIAKLKQTNYKCYTIIKKLRDKSFKNSQKILSGSLRNGAECF